MKNTVSLLCLVCCLQVITLAQKRADSDNASIKKSAISAVNDRYDQFKKIAMDIWGYAEVGYKEKESSALLQRTLKENGFDVQAGVAEIPTAFVASFGSGKPVIGILAEFDALPGLSQHAIP